MQRTSLILIGSVVALTAMIVLLARPRLKSTTDSGQPLLLYCAASNRAVMEAIRADYEKECGRPIEIQYGGSQTLLSSLEVSGTGDLYLPADNSYLELAKQKGLVAEILPIARMQAVVAVRKGNPKSIMTFSDLLRDDVRVAQASPDSTAIGKVTRQVLLETGQWEQLEKATAANRTTVTEAANDVVVGAADAAIVYDAVLHTYPDLEAVEIAELEPAASDFAIGVLTVTRQSASSLHFARYVTARDRGLLRYTENGFQVSGGDTWSDVPELNFFAGSMLRPAIEDSIAAFQRREGVEVNTVYNGCGILVAQMKAGQKPDAYFACDTEFMNQVPDLFPEPIDVSQNELVILVQKGNPQGIASLKDLGRSGLRVGVGHEKQCAMGWLTQNTFREGGVQQEVMANVTVQTPTGDMLVNQLRTGSLDAAVAYLSNAAGSGEYLDAIQIQGLQCSVATQPLAIAPDSPNRQTASRLFQQICSDSSRQSFLSEGFRWQLPTADDRQHD